MKLLRRVLYVAAVFFLGTVAAIYYMPDMNFVPYVVPVMQVATVALIVLAAEAFRKEGDMTMHDKNVLMNAFIVVILGASFFTASAFVHLSQTSWSNGEIHWHADYEILAENENGELERLDLIDPGQFCQEYRDGDYMCKVNDRTGITKFHEHNDNRIHLEGVFQEREEATLAAYFSTFNGTLTSSKLRYPTNEEIVEVSESAETNNSLKIVVRSGVADERSWKVIDNPSEYVISPYKRGPNLDDIFIVWDNQSANYVKEQLRVNNGTYRGHGLVKQGEGF
jgi:hypothetical protein